MSYYNSTIGCDYNNNNNNNDNKQLKQYTQINIYDLYVGINERKKKKTKCFIEVLHKLHKKIQKVADKEKYRLYYDVPEFLIGLPSYDLNNCIAFLMKELRNNGFLVKYYFPKILYVSWCPIEIRNYKADKKAFNMKVQDNRAQALRENREKQLRQEDFNAAATQAIMGHGGIPTKNFLHNHGTILPQYERPPPVLETQQNQSIFKPILTYNPNVIPTYNYYAYSSLNNNLMNENLFMATKPQNTGNTKIDIALQQKYNIEKNSFMDNLNRKQLEYKRELDNKNKQNSLYQKDITDYYGNNDFDFGKNPYTNPGF